MPIARINLFLPTTMQMNLYNQTSYYSGKVREVYGIGADKILLIASDRISAFDHILDREIPYKGQVLNQLAAYFLVATKDIIPNWWMDSPLANVSYGLRCAPIPIEVIVRGNLAGHAWREYEKGSRTLCGINLPEGMKKNESFPKPIITPSTKAEEGHDEDISREEILNQGIVSPELYAQIEEAALALFQRGREMAEESGLHLVDTKYEFGIYNDQLFLMDEIHTPDSSRYWELEGLDSKIENSEAPDQLSKEFVREWLMSEGFQGKEGQKLPEMSESKAMEISDRYIQMYERITGQNFEKVPPSKNLEQDLNAYLENIKD